MKLILTSAIFSNKKATRKGLEFFDKPVDKSKILLVDTPLFPEETDWGFVKLLNNGFAPQNIYTFDINHPEWYKDMDLDIIYVCGGNTFTGLWLLKYTGFDKEIINYVKNGVTYIGQSAGAHIATKNIEHVKEFDENYVGLTDYSGLGLLDGVVVCHYTKNRKPCYKRLVKERKFNTYKIKDNQILVANDSSIRKY